MAPLDQFPRLMLRLPFFGNFGMMPPDRSRIEQDLCPAQRREACAFGEPLVPTHQHANLGVTGVESLEAEVTWCEVKLLIVEWVIRDMHFAILPHQRPVGIDDHGGIMEESFGALLEELDDKDNLEVSRDLAKGIRGRAGDGLGKTEEVGIFALAEIQRTEQFLKADDLCALLRGETDAFNRFRQVLFRVLATRHLDESQRDLPGRFCVFLHSIEL